MREAPNLERTVRGSTGSHPLLVSYIFCTSAFYSSWWSIIDHLLYQHKVLRISANPTPFSTHLNVLLHILDLNKFRSFKNSENLWASKPPILTRQASLAQYIHWVCSQRLWVLCDMCRVFTDSWPAMNLVMQRRTTIQSGESNQWKCLLLNVSDANREKLNPCTEQFWDQLGFKFKTHHRLTPRD